MNKARFFILLCSPVFFAMGCGVAREVYEDETPVPQGKITAVLDNIIQTWEGQDQFVAEYQRITGIELDIIQPPHEQYMDKLLIRMAAGNLPDVCEVLPEYLPALIEDDLLLPLDDFIAESSYIRSVPQDHFEAIRYPDESLYGVKARDGGGCVTYIRKDWLDALGLDIPTDWHSFVEVLRAFTYDDPDGNGLDDTVGYTDVRAGSHDWYNRAVMLDARVEIHFDGERWVDGFTEPPMREALERLRFLYHEGLIDRDFITHTTYSARSMFHSGEAGVFTYWANHWARNLQDRIESTVGEEAQILPIPSLEGTRYINRIGPVLSITVGAEDPQFVFTNFIDRQYDKGAIQSLFTYGVEGYHWENQNGMMTFLRNPNDPHQGVFTKSFVPPASVLNGFGLMPLDPLVERTLSVFRSDLENERLQTGGETFARYALELETGLKPDIISQIVTGRYTIDQGLAEYSRRANLLSVNAILAELNGISPN